MLSQGVTMPGYLRFYDKPNAPSSIGVFTASDKGRAGWIQIAGMQWATTTRRHPIITLIRNTDAASAILRRAADGNSVRLGPIAVIEMVRQGSVEKGDAAKDGGSSPIGRFILWDALIVSYVWYGNAEPTYEHFNLTYSAMTEDWARPNSTQRAAHTQSQQSKAQAIAHFSSVSARVE
jgi:hypothetical protein